MRHYNGPRLTRFADTLSDHIGDDHLKPLTFPKDWVVSDENDPAWQKQLEEFEAIIKAVDDHRERYDHMVCDGVEFQTFMTVEVDDPAFGKSEDLSTYKYHLYDFAYGHLVEPEDCLSFVLWCFGMRTCSVSMTPQQILDIANETENDITSYISDADFLKFIDEIKPLIQNGWEITQARGHWLDASTKFVKNDAFTLTVNGTEMQFDSASMFLDNHDNYETVFNKDGSSFRCNMTLSQLSNAIDSGELQLDGSLLKKFNVLNSTNELEKLLNSNGWEPDDNNENVWHWAIGYRTVFFRENRQDLGSVDSLDWTLTVINDHTIQVDVEDWGEHWTGELNNMNDIKEFATGDCGWIRHTSQFCEELYEFLEDDEDSEDDEDDEY